MQTNLRDRIFKIDTRDNFNEVALKIFRYQYKSNPVYQKFIGYLNINYETVNIVSKIPFLPIEFFKSRQVVSGNKKVVGYFQSSGTTSQTTSRHYFNSLGIYEQSFTANFRYFYGNISEYCILALLPSYLQQPNSSLVYMATKLIELSGNSDSGFYLNNYDELAEKIRSCEKHEQPTILIGVTYALLDLIEKHHFNLKKTIVIETGGMKGRRREIIREELHNILCRGFGVETIHSEYGMTELFSQAWSTGNGIFKTPYWMKVLIRDINDPLSLLDKNKTGGINIIDLANIQSCCFIATKDLGRKIGENTFEVLGRFDNSDVRGCNLMID